MSARLRLVRDLERAADNVQDIPRHELQILLKQAALLLRNLPGSSAEQWEPFRRPQGKGNDPEPA